MDTPFPSAPLAPLFSSCHTLRYRYRYLFPLAPLAPPARRQQPDLAQRDLEWRAPGVHEGHRRTPNVAKRVGFAADAVVTETECMPSVV